MALSAGSDGGPDGRAPVARGFFRMARAEAWALVCLLVYSAICFLPVWRDIEVAGMDLFGWMMAALMLLSPALMLVVFARRRAVRR
jgi:hypothetical protein